MQVMHLRRYQYVTEVIAVPQGLAQGDKEAGVVGVAGLERQHSLQDLGGNHRVREGNLSKTVAGTGVVLQFNARAALGDVHRNGMFAPGPVEIAALRRDVFYMLLALLIPGVVEWVSGL